MKRLGNYVNIKTGKLDANASSENGQYPFFTCSVEPLKIDEYSYDCECVLVAGNGDLNVKYYNGKFDAYQRTYIIESKDKNILGVPYLYCFLDGYVEELRKQSIGGVIKYIKLGNLTEAQIPMRSINAQNEVVANIKKANELISFRKQQLAKLDELVKSRFIEMFGDPKTNPNSFDIVPFNECVEYMGDIGSNGANQVVVDHLDMKEEEDYALMVRFLNFTKNDFADDVKYISKESYEFFKKSQIFGGELIICKIGSAGQNYVMPYLNRPVSLGLNQIMVRINGKTLMPYLYRYINSDYGKQLINGCINGAVTKSITKTELKKIPIVIPPIELQTQFAAFVEQVDKSKFEIQKSLNQLETLKKALMQKYFG